MRRLMTAAAGAAMLASLLCGVVFPIPVGAQATPGADETGDLEDGAFRAVASFLDEPLTGRAAFIAGSPMGSLRYVWLVLCDDAGGQVRWMTVKGRIGEEPYPPVGAYPQQGEEMLADVTLIALGFPSRLMGRIAPQSAGPFTLELTHTSEDLIIGTVMTRPGDNTPFDLQASFRATRSAGPPAQPGAHVYFARSNQFVRDCSHLIDPP